MTRTLEDPDPDPLAFLAAGGEMGGRIRDFDWRPTSVGPAESWSPALRGILRIVLADRLPRILWLGSDHLQLYNDSCRSVAGARHPERMLGLPARECWNGAWKVIGPLIEQPFSGGPATIDEDVLVEVDRDGSLREHHYSIACSPVADPAAPTAIAAVIGTLHEVTDRVVGDRRIGALRELARGGGEARTAHDACATAAEKLAAVPLDLPFVLIYLLDPDGGRLRLAGTTGVDGDDSARPATVDLRGNDPTPWPFREAIAARSVRLVDRLESRLAAVPSGPWPDPPRQAVVVPIPGSRPERPAAVMVAGLSPRLAFDRPYRDFIELVRAQVAAAIAIGRVAEEGRAGAGTAGSIGAETEAGSGGSRERLRLAVEAADRRTAQLEAVIDRAPLGVFQVDAGLRITEANAVAREAFGEVPGGVIGGDFGAIVRRHWEASRADEILRIFGHTLETGESQSVSRWIERRIDRNVTEYYQWRTERIERPDGSFGVVCFFRDIAEPVRAREEIEAGHAALAEAGRRKDEFLATLAHELRNPLAPLQSSLNVLRLAADASDLSLVERVHGMMARQVSHLVRLVDDLTEASRITRGTVTLRREPVALADVVAAAVDAGEASIARDRHRLVVEVPPEPLVVDGDPVRLSQILTNLLDNATRYTITPGKIALTVRREGREAIISVRDSGVGIPAEMLPRVFDLFTQVDRTYERAQGGLGIGLSLVRKLVELHGGRVEARSEGTGRGSEFVVRLPLATRVDRPRPSDAHKSANPAGSRHRVLIVDDNRDAAESLGMLLRLLGIDVFTVGDGNAALDALRTFRPSVLLLDIGLPGMDGYTVARQIRADPAFRRLPIIAMTGWGQEKDRRSSSEAGIDHHLVKPVDIDALRELLGKFPTPS